MTECTHICSGEAKRNVMVHFIVLLSSRGSSEETNSFQSPTDTPVSPLLLAPVMAGKIVQGAEAAEN